MRWRHSSQVYKNHMFVFGGAIDDDNDSNDVWKLDLGKFSFLSSCNIQTERFIWSKCQTLGNAPGKSKLSKCMLKSIDERRSHSSALCNELIYIFGGFSTRNNSTNHYLNDLWTLNLGKN
jgi:hypothetical protein